MQLSENGVTILTVNTAAAFLQNFCGDRIARLGFWPPRSPDLTSPDFFLLGSLQERVYSRNSRNSVKIVNTCLEECGWIESFIYPTDAQLDFSKNVKIYIKIYMRGASTCFGFLQPSSGSYYMCFAKL